MADAARRESATQRRARERSLWHRPSLINLIADLVLFGALIALAWAVATWFVTRPLFPLRELVVVAPGEHTTLAQLQYVARAAIQGNFFTVDLDRVRGEFEKLPWVRNAQVRRRWPDALELSLEEHRPVAFWQSLGDPDTRLINDHGEVFVAATDARLPVVSGPAGSAGFVWAQYQRFSSLLDPVGDIARLNLSARAAWTISLDNELEIVLGRALEEPDGTDRLQRFVRAWPLASAQLGMQVARADLRHANGFALLPRARLKETATP